MNKLVSILIPSYNAANYIEDTVKSVINQTYQNIEIIIVDDESVDDTYRIIKSYEDKNIKVIKRKHGGAANCRNIAFAHSQGEFIQYLDSDDLLNPDKIKLQLQCYREEKDVYTLMTASWASFYNKVTNATLIPSALWKDYRSVEWLIDSFRYGLWMQPASFLMNRKICELAGSWDTRLSLNDDGEYFSRIVGVSKRVRFTDKSICYYRKGIITSLSNMRDLNALYSLELSIFLSVKNLLKLEYNKYTKIACAALLNKLFMRLYPYSYLDPIKNMIRDTIFMIKLLDGQLKIPKETTSYKIMHKIFGKRNATKTRDKVWNMRQKLRKALADTIYQKIINIENFKLGVFENLQEQLERD